MPLNYYPENENKLRFDYPYPWDLRPWFQVKEGKTGKPKKIIQENQPKSPFNTLTHYRIINFAKFNATPEEKPKKKKVEVQKKPKVAVVIPNDAVVMPEFQCQEPYEILESRIRKKVAYLRWSSRGHYIKITTGEPLGFVRIPLPLSLQDVKPPSHKGRRRGRRSKAKKV